MKFGTRLVIAGVVLALWHVVSFPLIFIVPRYKKVWDDAGVRLSFSKELLIRISDFMAQWWFIVLPAVIAAAVLFAVWPYIIRRPA